MTTKRQQQARQATLPACLEARHCEEKVRELVVKEEKGKSWRTFSFFSSSPPHKQSLPSTRPSAPPHRGRKTSPLSPERVPPPLRRLENRRRRLEVGSARLRCSARGGARLREGVVLLKDPRVDAAGEEVGVAVRVDGKGWRKDGQPGTESRE